MFNLAPCWFSACSSIYPVGIQKFDFALYVKLLTSWMLITGICLSTTNTCTKFQPDWSTHTRVIAIFLQGARKEEKFSESLIARILGMAEQIFFQIWNVASLSGGHLHCKFGAIQIRHQSYTAWKLRVCSSCLSICTCPVFLDHMTHYRVSWWQP